MPDRSLRLFDPTSENTLCGSENPLPTGHQSTATQSRRQRELDRVCGINTPKSVTIPLATMVPLLIQASEKNNAWLGDFQDESVRIDSDLYDVLMAYQSLQANSAA